MGCTTSSEKGDKNKYVQVLAFNLSPLHGILCSSRFGLYSEQGARCGNKGQSSWLSVYVVVRASFINIARGLLQARGEARPRLRLNAAAAPSANRRKPQRVCAHLSRPQRAFAEPPARNLSPTPRRIQPSPCRP